MGIVGSMALVCVFIGGLMIAQLADKIRRRKVIIACVIVVSCLRTLRALGALGHSEHLMT